MQVQVDPAKAEAFAARLLAALNDGALCLMVSVGHRTRLFDVMSQSPTATLEELAAGAGLDERYVREWLGAMVAGRVVNIDPATSISCMHCMTVSLAQAAKGWVPWDVVRR